jgi:malate/lactate dehydrogenase
VPVKLGEKRVEEIIEIKLADEEEKALRHSADAVQALLEDMKRLSEWICKGQAILSLASWRVKN